MNTPWGQSQTIKNIGNGVFSVSTASHGGIFVPDELLLCFTQSEKDYAEKWSGSKNWYEEDCAAAIPMFRLPELFPMDEGKRKEYYNNAKIYWEK